MSIDRFHRDDGHRRLIKKVNSFLFSFLYHAGVGSVTRDPITFKHFFFGVPFSLFFLNSYFTNIFHYLLNIFFSTCLYPLN